MPLTSADIHRLVKGKAIRLTKTTNQHLIEGKALIALRVILHVHPDLDAIAAYWLALKYPKVFLGIETAPVEFWPQGLPPDGRTSEEHELEGTLCFDIGQGRFDHHPHGVAPKKCAMDLVADFIRKTDAKSLSRILDYVRMHDLEGPMILSRTLRDLCLPEDIVYKAKLLEFHSRANIMGHMHNQLEDLQIVQRTCEELSAAYGSQRHFWNVVGPSFKKNARLLVVEDDIRMYKVALIESDLRRAGSFSRTDEGGFFGVCIHRTPKTGFVFISSAALASEQYGEIAKFLRVWEMQKRGIDMPFVWSDLTQAEMTICPSWYLPTNQAGKIHIIMNGGEKAIAVQPTILTIEEIFNAVAWGIDERILADECPGRYCLGRICGFYPFGLNRCHRIRDEAQAIASAA